MPSDHPAAKSGSKPPLQQARSASCPAPASGGQGKPEHKSEAERVHPRDPLHGVTLKTVINQLVQRHGWGEMGRRIPIRCFQFNPTVKSSLTFLRKTPWARQKVENWYLAEL